MIEDVFVHQGCFWHCLSHYKCCLSWQAFGSIFRGYVLGEADSCLAMRRASSKTVAWPKESTSDNWLVSLRSAAHTCLCLWEAVISLHYSITRSAAKFVWILSMWQWRINDRKLWGLNPQNFVDFGKFKMFITSKFLSELKCCLRCCLRLSGQGLRHIFSSDSTEEASMTI